MDIADKLMREIESRRDDLVELTQELIRIPTLNPPGISIATSAIFLIVGLCGMGLRPN